MCAIISSPRILFTSRLERATSSTPRVSIQRETRVRGMLITPHFVVGIIRTLAGERVITMLINMYFCSAGITCALKQVPCTPAKVDETSLGNHTAHFKACKLKDALQKFEMLAISIMKKDSTYTHPSLFVYCLLLKSIRNGAVRMKSL